MRLWEPRYRLRNLEELNYCLLFTFVLMVTNYNIAVTGLHLVFCHYSCSLTMQFLFLYLIYFTILNHVVVSIYAFIPRPRLFPFRFPPSNALHFLFDLFLLFHKLFWCAFLHSSIYLSGFCAIFFILSIHSSIYFILSSFFRHYFSLIFGVFSFCRIWRRDCPVLLLKRLLLHYIRVDDK